MRLNETQTKMVDQKINHWLARLLDLSGRNRLLHFKETKTTTIEIRYPSPVDLFTRLVEKGSSISFPLTDRDALPLFEDLEDKTAKNQQPIPEGQIGSGYTPKDLSRRLYNLLSRSRTAREEQGVNILFIAFGFLKWRDAVNGDQAFSPLVLVPVELAREAPGKPYQLSMLEEDLVVNPTLQEALRQYFALELNDLPDDLTAAGLDQYWETISTLISTQKDWALDTRVVMDVWSYQKQIIVADLKRNAGVLRNHDLTVSMSIPGFPLPKKDLNLLSAEELDEKVSPLEVFQILDADSSQQEAIEAAKAGLSFVLQGPPGTGKSQTIANIIAEFMASGRHVLFVSAKMAALEVVQDRLKKSELGEFCLQVHSHKRNKREVIEELGQSLDASPEAIPQAVNDHLDILHSTRQDLNAYVHALHAPRFGLGLSAFEAYSQLTKYWDRPDLRFILSNITTITARDFDTVKGLVSQLSSCNPVISNYMGHPWFGVKLDVMTLEKKGEIENHLSELRRTITLFALEMSRIAAVYGVFNPATLGQGSDLFRLARWYETGVMAIPAADISKRYQKDYQSALRYIRPQYWKDSSLLSSVSRNKKRPDPQKAVDALNFIVKMQGRRIQPSVNSVEPSPDMTKSLDLVTAIKSEIDYVNALYQEEQKPGMVKEITGQPIEKVLDWLQMQASQTGRLSEWVGFQKLFHQAEKQGIGSFVQEGLQNPFPGDQWLPAFLKRFYTLWIDAVASQEPSLGSFNSKAFENTIQKFQELDKEHVRLAKLRIREKLLQHRPKVAWMNVASAEETILRRELNKKRRIKPLRRLFAEIPGLILRLRPCLMMSPLSVSMLLDTNLYQFDLVIFDEASQIHPEEAVGAVIRGQQVIIVGDRHQLPPTAFFEVLDADEEGDEEMVVEDLESVLNEGEAAGLPSKMLQWHYRSKDESLIAFSNHYFYQDHLQTFPAANQDKKETGVSFCFIPDGVYQRGGRRNQVEAKKVVDLILDHYRQHPELSLGVVTFSQAQREAIQMELDQRLRELPDLQGYFSDNADEPAFVKNLELVQGDERDVMIFSVGYGKDETGKFILNFGPLNQEGGERRLNVAVTRARCKVILVSSIQPEDIDLSRTNSQGVRLLRSYMTLARDGIKAIYADLQVTDDADFESPFETSVYDALVDRGVILKRQVGVSGYRIDLGIVDPDQPGHFLLGIECDGAMYHSGKTARDRDRLRQQVLEGLGWHIHRIWSRDWIDDREHEIQKVLMAIKQVAALSAENDTGHADDAKKTPKPRTIALEMKAVKLTPVIEKLPGGVIYYEKTSIPRKDFGIEGFYRQPEYKISQLIESIVKTEGPIEIGLLTERIANAWGIKRIGSRIRSSIGAALNVGLRTKKFEIRGNFVWPKGLLKPTVRAQSENGTGREIDQVCDEEIAEAVYCILEEAISLDKEDIVRLAAHLFGARVNDHTSERVNLAVNSLLDIRRIEWRSNKFRIPKE